VDAGQPEDVPGLPGDGVPTLVVDGVIHLGDRRVLQEIAH
jgi:hypothetical protein